jgi:DDE superfamily endonuclease
MEPKKRSVGASERDEWLRAAWRVMVGAQVDPERLVFVDEMGTNTSLYPVYAWAPKGRRAYCWVPRNRGRNTTLLSSMSLCGMGPSLAVDGPIDREVFVAYVERVLAPTLRAGQVVVMDNLSAHKGERVRKLIERRGCELLAALLAGSQSHRGGFRQDKELPTESRGPHPRGLARGDGASALGG